MADLMVDITEPSGFYTDGSGKSKTLDRVKNFDKPSVNGNDGVESISFNYFIKWEEGFNTGALIPEVWIKRIITFRNLERISVQDFMNSDANNKLIETEGLDRIITAYELFKKFNIKMRYLLILNKNIPSNISEDAFIGGFMDFSLEDNDFRFSPLSIKKIKQYIRQYTGVPLKIGKGLKVAETYLEYYLSKTDTPFPGDCDELVFSKGRIDYILEYKKCTKKDKCNVMDQTFYRFYSHKDRLKYDRLNILRKYYESVQKDKIPLINVLYSVEENDPTIKLERISEKMKTEKDISYTVSKDYIKNKRYLYEYAKILSKYKEVE